MLAVVGYRAGAVAVDHERAVVGLGETPIDFVGRRRTPSTAGERAPLATGGPAAVAPNPPPGVGSVVLPRLCETGRHTADGAFVSPQQNGILARRMGGYGLPNAIRITVGTGEENEKVAAALAAFMAS